MNEIDIKRLLDQIFSFNSVPSFKAPVIVFDSKDDKTIYPSGLMESKDAERYADYWMSNQ